MSENPPLIYCDLIHEQPVNRHEFYAAHTGEDVDDIRLAYDQYLEPLFRSTERYLHEADARHAIDLAFGSGSNVYLRRAEHGDESIRMATP